MPVGIRQFDRRKRVNEGEEAFGPPYSAAKLTSGLEFQNCKKNPLLVIQGSLQWSGQRKSYTARVCLYYVAAWAKQGSRQLVFVMLPFHRSTSVGIPRQFRLPKGPLCQNKRETVCIIPPLLGKVRLCVPLERKALVVSPERRHRHKCGSLTVTNPTRVFRDTLDLAHEGVSFELLTLFLETHERWHLLYLLDAVLLDEHVGGVEIGHHARQARVEAHDELLRRHIAGRRGYDGQNTTTQAVKRKWH